MLFQNTKKNTVRILLFTSRTLHVFSGGKEHLTEEKEFSVDEMGLAGFDRYMSDSSDIPVYFVVDLSEEDFRVESVAHVRGKDQKMLLERKLLQHFRNTEYRSIRIQDREEGGRRDDRVLLSALTNTEQLDPWIDYLLQKKVRIKGIVSVPLLMELFCEFMQLGTLPHLLLVNLEERIGLRQTYLQKKKVKFSRLLSIFESESLAERLLAECRHTRQYLERQKLLPHDKPLEVHVCAADGMAGELGKGLVASPMLQFHVHETGMVGAELGIDPEVIGDHGSVYLSICQALRAGKLFNAYAPSRVTRYHRLRQIRQGLIVGTSLMVLAAMPAGGLLLHEGFTMGTERQQLLQETLRFQGQYGELQRTFPETPIPAADMRAVVESAERIQVQEILPKSMMIMVSRALASCPDIYLQQFDWQLYTETGFVDGTNANAERLPEAAGVELGQVPVPAILPDLLAGKAVAVTVVSGVVSPSGGYGNAQQSVGALIAALEKMPGMKVTPLAMPTDTKPNTTVKAKLDDGDILAEFSLKLEYQRQR
ncbi:MAG: hypothetical protein KJ630_08940 [Proteobacteria bacterium]|nr:hypothetical protein [Pseudomonadota bacterium]